MKKIIGFVLLSISYGSYALDSTTATGYTTITGTVIDNTTNTTTNSTVTSTNSNTNTNTNTDNITSSSTITSTGTNTNANTNTNTTSYTGTNTNTNNNTNTNTNTNNNTNTNTNNNTNTNTNTSTITQAGGTTNSNTNTNNNTNNTDSTIRYENMPVNTPHAPNVTINQSDLCVKGISGGAQTTLLGLSMGATIKDENCERIKLARMLRDGGMKVASISILCEDPRVFKAMMMSGTPCPFKGKIGKKAAKMWNKYPELRPDSESLQDEEHLLIASGKMDRNNNMIPEEEWPINVKKRKLAEKAYKEKIEKRNKNCTTWNWDKSKCVSWKRHD